jgi:nicotinate-nucleotide adenylyltransferase
MRIAFFGGTFDPPHCGHIAIARAAIERLALDRVLVAPVGTQPLKGGLAHSSYEDRMAMVRLAVASDPRLAASEVDAPLPGGQPNYTFDTLQRLRHQLQPSDKLFCLLGADSFLTLNRWHQCGKLLFLCDFIVAGRPAGERSAIFLLPDLDKDISATEIRAARAEGAEQQTLLAPAVAEYIRAHSLYRPVEIP